MMAMGVLTIAIAPVIVGIAAKSCFSTIISTIANYANDDDRCNNQEYINRTQVVVVGRHFQYLIVRLA